MKPYFINAAGEKILNPYSDLVWIASARVREGPGSCTDYKRLQGGRAIGRAEERIGAEREPAVGAKSRGKRETVIKRRWRF